jgi:hypothetical protein
MHAENRSREERRISWQTSVLAPLYRGRNPSCWQDDIGGVRFIGIDNSTGLVTAAQLQLFKSATKMAAACVPPLPVVLLVHIPLFEQRLLEIISAAAFSRRPGSPPEPAMDASALCGGPATADASTLEFVEAVRECTGLGAILCGHIHTAQAQPYGSCGATQLVADGGVFGGTRLLDLVPSVNAKL